MLFREQILDQLKPDSVILDLDASEGIVSQMNFKGLAGKVCGVDLDPRVADNPMQDEGRVSDAGEIPYDDELFDVVFSDNVLKHLDAPLAVYAGVARVLRVSVQYAKQMALHADDCTLDPSRFSSICKSTAQACGSGHVPNPISHQYEK